MVVDHEVDIIAAADWVIEIGPGSGDEGGQVIAQGTPKSLVTNPKSLIGPFISGHADILQQKHAAKKPTGQMTHLKISDHFNLHNVDTSSQITKLQPSQDSLVPAKPA